MVRPSALPVIVLVLLAGLSGCIRFESNYEGPDYGDGDAWGEEAFWLVMMVILAGVLFLVIVLLLGGGAVFAMTQAAQSSQPEAQPASQPAQEAAPASSPEDQVTVTPPDPDAKGRG